MTTAQKPFHVLIVGAGLAGMALAQALRKQGITFEIFERDAAVHSRFQGWAIALHRILADFKESLPEDLGPVESTSHLLPLDVPAQFSYYVDNVQTSCVTAGEDVALVRANRNRLRDYLAQNLTIQWDKHWTSIEESADSVTLHFDDGTSATGDLLVGADGVHSKVRTHILSGKDPLYTVPVATIIGETAIPKPDYEKFLALGHSVFVSASSSGQSLFSAVNSVSPDGSHVNYYWMASAGLDSSLSNGGEGWAHHASKAEQFKAALEHTSEMDPKFTDMIRRTGEEGIYTGHLVFRDIIIDEMPATRATLVGDSAHAMTPARGEGGNTAMQDSLDLARTITQIASSPSRDNMLSLLDEYQKMMLKRAKPIVLASRAAMMNVGRPETARAFDNWSKDRSVYATATAAN